MSGLDIQVFPDGINFTTLEAFLECFDNIILKRVSREEYSTLREKLLITGGDKFGPQYQLIIPIDLTYGEIPDIIDMLSKYFELGEYTSYNQLISHIKVFIYTLLREEGDELGGQKIKGLQEKYNISEELSQKISNIRISPNREVKSMIRRIKMKREENTSARLGREIQDSKLIESELQELFQKELLQTFFRHGINTLRLKMMTFTQNEQEKLIGKKGDIVTHLPDEKLDQISQKLREKINIDTLKGVLQEVRGEGDREKINELEKLVADLVLGCLFEYPYQNTKDQNGFMPSTLLKHKEITCVGFSLLGHCFLEELGIKHHIMDIPQHSAVQVIIGNVPYYFDPTFSPCMYGYEVIGKKGVFTRIKLQGIEHTLLMYANNAESVLISQIASNIGYTLYESRKYQEIIEICSFALRFNSQSMSLFYNLGSAFYELRRFEEAIKSYDTALSLYPQFTELYYLKALVLKDIGKHEIARLYIFANKQYEQIQSEDSPYFTDKKNEILQKIKEADYEGLYQYLLHVEETLDTK